MFKDYKKFLNIMKNLRFYFVKFKKNRFLKTKKYPNDYIIEKINIVLLL